MASEFDRALNFVTNGPKSDTPLSNETKLKFYALFKQVKEGPNNTPKPGMFDFVARAKWEAWKKLGNMSKEEAGKEYVKVLESVTPNWRDWAQPGAPKAQPAPAPAKKATPTPAPAPAPAPAQAKAGSSGRATAGQTKSVFRPDTLAGKVALVTGGGSGICKGVTEVLMKHGAKAVLLSRSEEKLKAAAAELKKATGQECTYVVADVRDSAAVEKAVDAALAVHGRIDILINGAAGNFLAAAEKLSYNAFKTVLEIDTMGTFNVSKAVYQKYMKAHGGSIINMSMTLHWTGMALQAHAGSAKAGVDAMTRHLAVEWGLNNVRVNAIAIGPIENTEGFKRLLPEPIVQQLRRSIPLNRFGTEEDIAMATLFLVSDAAPWVTGSIVTVDGGSWMTTAGFGYPDMLSRL